MSVCTIDTVPERIPVPSLKFRSRVLCMVGSHPTKNGAGKLSSLTPQSLLTNRIIHASLRRGIRPIFPPNNVDMVARRSIHATLLERFHQKKLSRRLQSWLDDRCGCIVSLHVFLVKYLAPEKMSSLHFGGLTNFFIDCTGLLLILYDSLD